MIRRHSLVALVSLAAAIGCTKPAPEAPAPAPAPVAKSATPLTPPSTVPGSGERRLGEAFASATHVTLALAQMPGTAPTSKSLDDKLPAVIAALGADRQPTPAMPRCMTPVTFTFTDAAGQKVGSVGFCDIGTPAEAMKQPGRIDYADGSSGGFTAADPEALAKFLP